MSSVGSPGTPQGSMAPPNRPCVQSIMPQGFSAPRNEVLARLQHPPPKPPNSIPVANTIARITTLPPRRIAADLQNKVPYRGPSVSPFIRQHRNLCNTRKAPSAASGVSATCRPAPCDAKRAPSKSGRPEERQRGRPQSRPPACANTILSLSPPLRDPLNYQRASALPTSRGSVTTG